MIIYYCDYNISRCCLQYAVVVDVDQILFPPAGDDGFDAVIEHKVQSLIYTNSIM